MRHSWSRRKPHNAIEVYGRLNRYAASAFSELEQAWNDPCERLGENCLRKIKNLNLKANTAIGGKNSRQPLLFGHFLIQRDEKTSLPTLLYSKLPKGITDCVVLVLEPMLATGGSACMAISALIDEGVPEENIVFVNVLASRHGLDVVKKRFPKLAVVTAAVDEDLTTNNFISPGLGDFGDRYFGTIG